MRRIIISFLILMFLRFGVSAAEQPHMEYSDVNYTGLSKDMNASDSIQVLYDIFDVAPQAKKTEVGWKILSIAQRWKNYDIMYNLIPEIGAINVMDIKEQEKLLEVASHLPEDDHKKAVVCFLKVNIATAEGSYITPEARHERLVEYLKEDFTPKSDVYQNFLDLYRVVVYMGLSYNGNLYMEYLERLEKMLADIPEAGFGFPNRFYTTAANFYTRNEMYAKAIEMDRKLLQSISELEKYYADKGRKYRNYDRFKYLCYRRMLNNYPGLKPAEIEEYYSKAKQLADGNEELREDFYDFRFVDGYYLMGKKRYSEAIPAIEAALKHTKSRSTRYSLLSMLREAARQTGNREVLLEALEEYNQMLEERMKANSEGAMLELKIRYEVKKIEEARMKAERENYELERASNEKLIGVALAALFVLAVILMLLYRSHFKLLNKSKSQKEEIENLHGRIEEILYKGTIPGTDDLIHDDHDEKENEQMPKSDPKDK